jgi:sporulation protein YlmC with PRC-barrel domain
MLRGVNKLQNYTIQATDGEIGSVYDALLDDEFWILRYLVADTARRLPARKVLLTPAVLGKPDWEQHHLPVKLSREQVKNSPDVDSDKPVSRQREMELHAYYGWPFYWSVPDGLPFGFEPPLQPTPLAKGQSKDHGDPHLRSVRELRGYGIQASDGEIGHVDDFIVDDETWDVRYMVVATTNWLPSRKVLISPQWLIGNISWEQHKVTVILTRESIKNSPEYKPSSPPTREYEHGLHEHYGRSGYWTAKRQAGKKSDTRFSGLLH